MFDYSLNKKQLETLLSKYEEYIDFQFREAKKGSQSFEMAFKMCNGYRDSLKNVCNSAIFRMKLNNISSKAICYIINAYTKEVK